MELQIMESEFWAGVLASIIASVVVAFVAYIFSKRVRFLISTKVNYLLSSGVEYAYENRKQAEVDIPKHLESATSVKLMTGRGHYLQNDEYGILFDRKKKFDYGIKIMLPNPYQHEGYDWIEQREKELREFDGSFGVDLHKKQIKGTIAFLENHVSSQRIDLRLHEYPIVGSVLLTDTKLYFTPMKPDNYIRRSRTYRFDYDSDMYKHYNRLFDQLWGASKPLGPAREYSASKSPETAI